MFISRYTFSAASGAQLPHTIGFFLFFLDSDLRLSFLQSLGGLFFFFSLVKSCLSLLCSQMKPEAKTVVSWCTVWQGSAALSPWLWLTLCRSSTCPWTMLTTLSKWRNPTYPLTSTSWASCLTLKGPWDSAAPVTTVSLLSNSTSPRPPTRMSTRWTPCNPRERHPPFLAGSVPYLQFLLGSIDQAAFFVCGPGVKVSPAVCIRQGCQVQNWLLRRERFAPFIFFFFFGRTGHVV